MNIIRSFLSGRDTVKSLVTLSPTRPHSKIRSGGLVYRGGRGTLWSHPRLSKS